MTDNAPERIWAKPEHPDENGYGGFWIKAKVAPAVEYIRADLYTAVCAERDRALEWRDHDRERAITAEAKFEQAKTLYRETLDRAVKAEAAIRAALERLDASLFTNAEHQQAKDILRGALKDKT